MSKNIITPNNTFYKTFTGSDSIAFAIFPNCKPITLGAVTTLSYSMYREKRPVPLLGRINVGGYTRGMRSIAGTLIFTLINQHFVRDLADQIPYLEGHGKIKSDELPFFDLMIINANEMGSSCQMMIYGVDLFEEGQVLSIQEMFVENNLSFVARDLDEFTASSPLKDSSRVSSNKVEKVSNISYLNEKKIEEDKTIYDVQKALCRLKYISKNGINGVYDNTTYNAILKFQSDNNISQGILDELTYKTLVTGEETMKITNRKGAFLYDDVGAIAIKLPYGRSVVKVSKSEVMVNNLTYKIKKEDFEERKKIYTNTIDVKKIDEYEYPIDSKEIKAVVTYNDNTIRVFKYMVNNNIDENITVLANDFRAGRPKVVDIYTKNNSNEIISKITFNIGESVWK